MYRLERMGCRSWAGRELWLTSSKGLEGSLKKKRKGRDKTSRSKGQSMKKPYQRRTGRRWLSKATSIYRHLAQQKQLQICLYKRVKGPFKGKAMWVMQGWICQEWSYLHTACMILLLSTRKGSCIPKRMEMENWYGWKQLGKGKRKRSTAQMSTAILSTSLTFGRECLNSIVTRLTDWKRGI